MVLAVFGLPAMALEPAVTEEQLVSQIRKAIETRDYAALEELIFWKDAGEIKKRIVRFELNRNLGRPIHSIEMKPFGAHSLDAVIATGKFAPNMDVTETVTVVFEEEPIDETGKLPTSVFLVGKRDDVYRIGLVNRKMDHDDDD